MWKRVLIYIAGIFILALGLILNTKTALGVAPINSVAYVAADMSGLTFGTCTFLQYLIFTTFQFVVYRKFTAKLLLQIPFSYAMGFLLDLYDALITFVPEALPGKLMLLAGAILFTALGAWLVVSMNFIVNPADGAVQALSTVIKQDFGQTKWKFDCSMMSLTLLVCLLVTHRLTGVGIGTVVTALLVGRTIRVYSRTFGKYLPDCGQ